MASVMLFKMTAPQLNANAVNKLSKKLGIKEKPIETTEGIAIKEENRTLVYGQPCAKLAGVLFYMDQTVGLAEPIKKPLSEKRAKSWSDDFLKEAKLLPNKPKDDRIKLDWDTHAYTTEGIVFNGKERKRVPVKTEIASRIQLNDIPVVGPRAKTRVVFKEKDIPVMFHHGAWSDLEVFEERELVREHDAASVVKEKLALRRECGKAYYDVIDIKLAYFASEFRGGPDLLAPYYFVEVEFKDTGPKGIEDIQGPRQMIWFPAFR